MKFNPDPNKQAREVHFSNGIIKDNSLLVKFNMNKVETIQLQKHLGLIFDERLNFNKHLESKINRFFKIIGFSKRLYNKLPRHAILRIYKFFLRSRLDYGDILHDKSNDESFASKLERVQDKACLANNRCYSRCIP